MKNYLELEINAMPPGLDRAIMRALSFRVGKENAIPRKDLLISLTAQISPLNDRVMRAQINQLRKSGYMICSTGGAGGGYYLARDWDELLDFVNQEIHARAMDLLEQEKALKKTAEKRWGRYSPEHQERLF